MLDINLLRNDPDKVRENIRKKFQDEKLPLVDEVIRMDREFRDAIQQGDNLRNKRKTISKEIGALMGKGLKDEAEQRKVLYLGRCFLIKVASKIKASFSELVTIYSRLSK